MLYRLDTRNKINPNDDALESISLMN